LSELKSVLRFLYLEFILKTFVWSEEVESVLEKSFVFRKALGSLSVFAPISLKLRKVKVLKVSTGRNKT